MRKNTTVLVKIHRSVRTAKVRGIPAWVSNKTNSVKRSYSYKRFSDNYKRNKR